MVNNDHLWWSSMPNMVTEMDAFDLQKSSVGVSVIMTENGCPPAKSQHKWWRVPHVYSRWFSKALSMVGKPWAVGNPIPGSYEPHDVGPTWKDPDQTRILKGYLLRGRGHIPDIVTMFFYPGSGNENSNCATKSRKKASLITNYTGDSEDMDENKHENWCKMKQNKAWTWMRKLERGWIKAAKLSWTWVM